MWGGGPFPGVDQRARRWQSAAAAALVVLRRKCSRHAAGTGGAALQGLHKASARGAVQRPCRGSTCGAGPHLVRRRLPHALEQLAVLAHRLGVPPRAVVAVGQPQLVLHVRQVLFWQQGELQQMAATRGKGEQWGTKRGRATPPSSISPCGALQSPSIPLAPRSPLSRLPPPPPPQTRWWRRAPPALPRQASCRAPPASSWVQGGRDTPLLPHKSAGVRCEHVRAPGLETCSCGCSALFPLPTAGKGTLAAAARQFALVLSQPSSLRAHLQRFAVCQLSLAVLLDSMRSTTNQAAGKGGRRARAVGGTAAGRGGGRGRCGVAPAHGRQGFLWQRRAHLCGTAPAALALT